MINLLELLISKLFPSITMSYKAGKGESFKVATVSEHKRTSLTRHLPAT